MATNVTAVERRLIFMLRYQGVGLMDIAVQVGRSKSTVKRVLKGK